MVRYRKVFPWMPYEGVDRGLKAPPVFEIPRVGKVGVLICYDGWFPEMARGLAFRGAEIILHPTLTTTADREQELVLARANAIVNQCYVVNVKPCRASVAGARSQWTRTGACCSSSASRRGSRSRPSTSAWSATLARTARAG